jgi:hypothetical protein
VSKASRHNPGVAFLERLLRLSEKSPDRKRPASAAPDYDTLSTAAMICAFEESIRAAALVGAVEIRMGRLERRHLIERVRVRDSAILARHLGRVPSTVLADQYVATLEPVASEGEPWVKELLVQIRSRWSRGESAFRLLPTDQELAREFFKLLAAISRDRARGIDARTFSFRTTGDTKAFDRHASRIAAVFGARDPQTERRPELIWKEIGLERFGHPVFLKGPVVLEDEHGVLADGRMTPFSSFHPETIPLMRLRDRPSLIMTIENYATFNRYVRETDDGSLVVYTGGFASVGVIDLMRRVMQLIKPSVPYYHWGDIDPGGLRIFRFLEETLPQKPIPYLMDRSLAEAHGVPASPDPSLASISKADSAVADMADWLAFGIDIKHLEQEALDPISPISVEQ